tara:strand:+ start:307 stop:2241 length:1935 start_codon:yes stop_codon:yes gene_type:complete
MIGDWLGLVPAVGALAVTLLLPGGAVLAIGWGARNLAATLLAPAVSVSIAAVAAVVAPLLGMRWGVWPIVVVTVAACLVAWLLRRWIGPSGRSAAPRSVIVVAILALAAVAMIIVAQLAWAFRSPESLAQRFDNIVHLNSVRYAVETGNASSFNIGATSDIAFYPGAWHAFASLAVELTGVSVPAAVNATNMVVAALVWPASATAATVALIGARRLSVIASAALSSGFGAFPFLFFNWGPLYPNALGYALVPAALACAARLLRPMSTRVAIRDSLLLAVVACGTFLAHPNGLLAAFAISAVFVISTLVVRVVQNPSRSSVVTLAVTSTALTSAAIGLWTVARTNPQHSSWPSWQTAAQAAGEALLFSPRGFFPSIVVAVLVVAGLATIVRHPARIPIATPWAIAMLLFVVSSGTPTEFLLRQILTNPWYNDANRLAALLPPAAIPFLVLGACSLWDRLLHPWLNRRRTAHVWVAVAQALAVVLLFSVATASNVREALVELRGAHESSSESLLLSPPERELLDRLSDEVDADALIIGSPRTGTSLAYAIASRNVVEKHIFGSPSEDELFLDAHLRDIDSDPTVCETVDRVGVTHVLDFGTQDISGTDDYKNAYSGVTNLSPGAHLRLIDSQGNSARLFAIVGCGE